MLCCTTACLAPHLYGMLLCLALLLWISSAQGRTRHPNQPCHQHCTLSLATMISVQLQSHDQAPLEQSALAINLTPSAQPHPTHTPISSPSSSHSTQPQLRWSPNWSRPFHLRPRFKQHYKKIYAGSAPDISKRDIRHDTQTLMRIFLAALLFSSGFPARQVSGTRTCWPRRFARGCPRHDGNPNRHGPQQPAAPALSPQGRQRRPRR